MVGVDLKALAMEVMTPNLYDIYNGHQLKVMSEVVALVDFKLSGTICDYLLMLYKYTTQTNMESITKYLKPSYVVRKDQCWSNAESMLKFHKRFSHSSSQTKSTPFLVRQVRGVIILEKSSIKCR